MEKWIYRLLIALLVLGGGIGCSVSIDSETAGTPSEALIPVTVQLRWTHQAQFGGLYAAQQNGYYAAEGLDVTFLEGGPGVDVLAPVLEGVAQFGIADASVLILARSRGEPVRAVAAIHRRSPIVFFSRQDAGIVGPEDFVGKVICLGRQGVPTLHAMMAHTGISPDQYEVMVGDCWDSFEAGEVDVLSGYVINEALRAQEAGYEIRMIHPDNYGVHFYADTLFTTDEIVANDPALVTRFLRASLKGWSYAIEHPEEIGELVLTYSPDADRSHQVAMLSASIPLVNTGEDQIGWMNPAVWDGMERTLRTYRVLTGTVDVTQVYTQAFLHQIYEACSEDE